MLYCCTKSQTQSVAPDYPVLPIRRLQVVYTSVGNLAYQFLMLNIDGATRNGALSLSVDSQDSNVCLPDCIELLRMMHQQVGMHSSLFL